MLNKNNRLKKKKEFSYVYKRGVSHANNLFVVYVVPTKYAESKFGISVSAKVGKSFVRSRVKRVLSEAIRLNVDKIKVNNYVFVARAEMANADFHITQNALLSSFREWGLLC